MRLKLDENLPTALVAELAERGHDADTVLDEGLDGQPDPVVVAAATDDDRMLATLDRGSGDPRRYPPGSTPASWSCDRSVRTPPPFSSWPTDCSRIRIR